MNSAKVIMILALFLTMKATIGQQSEVCSCTLASNHTDCNTRGCSLGTNRYCNDGTFDSLFFFVFVIHHIYDDPPGRFGCNCPNSLSNSTYNGYYGLSGYNYATCTDYGGNAHRPGANAAVDCCNFCCARNDPYPPTTPTTSTTTTHALTTTTTTPEPGLSLVVIIGIVVGSTIFICVCIISIICIIRCCRDSSDGGGYTNYTPSYRGYTPPAPNDNARRQREREAAVHHQREREAAVCHVHGPAPVKKSVNKIYV